MELLQFFQIRANWRNGSTGQLSAITTTQIAIGCFVKAIKSTHETGDPLIIATLSTGAILNAVVLYQIYLYRDNPIDSKKTD